MLTPGGLVLALLMTAPALWDVIQGSMGLAQAMIRLLGALVVVAIGTAVLRRVLVPARPSGAPDDRAGSEQLARRHDDA